MQTYNPVFIIGSYRSGTSLLFRLLSESKEFLSLYRESKHLWRSYARNPNENEDTLIFDRRKDGFFVDRVTGRVIDDLNATRKYFDKHYNFSAYDNYCLGYLSRVRLLRERMPYLFNLMNLGNYVYKQFRYPRYRFIDKTPPNMYKVDLLEALYPDAKFIYLVRNGIDNINSLINGWNDERAFDFAYRKYLTEGIKLNIDGYNGQVWKFYITEDWKDWISESLERVCAHQWIDAHEHALESFQKMDPGKYIQVKFEDIQANPSEEIRKICDFVQIDFDDKLYKITRDMPLVNTDSKADPSKKFKNYSRLQNILEYIDPMQKCLGYH